MIVNCSRNGSPVKLSESQSAVHTLILRQLVSRFAHIARLYTTTAARISPLQLYISTLGLMGQSEQVGSQTPNACF